MACRIYIRREYLAQAPYNKSDSEKSPDVSLDSVGPPKRIQASYDANATERKLQRVGYKWPRRSCTHSAYDGHVERGNYPGCTNQTIARESFHYAFHKDPIPASLHGSRLAIRPHSFKLRLSHGLPPERRKPEYTHHFEYAVDRPKLMAEPLKEAHNLNGLAVSCSKCDPALTHVGFRKFLT